MRLEDIPESIKNSPPSQYEIEQGITTKEVYKIEEYSRVAYFHGIKSDNTMTLFIAFKLSRNNDHSWQWWGPNEETALALKRFGELYDDVQDRNLILRRI